MYVLLIGKTKCARKTACVCVRGKLLGAILPSSLFSVRLQREREKTGGCALTVPGGEGQGGRGREKEGRGRRDMRREEGGEREQ